MKLRQFVKIHPLIFAALVLMLAVCIFDFFINPKTAVFELACLLITALVIVLFLNKSFNAVKETVGSLNDSLSYGFSSSLACI